jgi:hypothetical protein
VALLVAVTMTLGAVEFRAGLSAGVTRLDLDHGESYRAMAPAIRVHGLWPVLRLDPLAVNLGLTGQAGAVLAVKGDDRRYVALQAAVGPLLGTEVKIGRTRLGAAGWWTGGYARQRADGPWAEATAAGFQRQVGLETTWLLPLDHRVEMGPRLARAQTRMPAGVELDEWLLGIELAWRSSP